MQADTRKFTQARLLCLCAFLGGILTGEVPPRSWYFTYTFDTSRYQLLPLSFFFLFSGLHSSIINIKQRGYYKRPYRAARSVWWEWRSSTRGIWFSFINIKAGWLGLRWGEIKGHQE
jgi:hypothetical protein